MRRPQISHDPFPPARRRFARLISAALAAGLVAAPLAAQPLDRYTTFRNMIGRAKTQSSVNTVIKQLGEYTVEKLARRDAEYYYSFPKRGVEIHFDAKHRIDFVVFMNEKAFTPYQKYAGSLPKEITFADDESAVVQKLGKPENAKDLSAEKERVLFYKKQGYSVIFYGAGAGAQKGRIKYVEIYARKTG